MRRSFAVRLGTLAQAAGGIRRGGHGGRLTATWGICGDFCRGGLGNADAGVQVDVIFAASGAVALAGIFIAQAGQFIAAANAIAVARFRSRLNRNERHNGEIVRFCSLARKGTRQDRENAESW